MAKSTGAMKTTPMVFCSFTPAGMMIFSTMFSHCTPLVPREAKADPTNPPKVLLNRCSKCSAAVNVQASEISHVILRT